VPFCARLARSISANVVAYAFWRTSPTPPARRLSTGKGVRACACTVRWIINILGDHSCDLIIYLLCLRELSPVDHKRESIALSAVCGMAAILLRCMPQWSKYWNNEIAFTIYQDHFWSRDRPRRPSLYTTSTNIKSHTARCIVYEHIFWKVKHIFRFCGSHTRHRDIVFWQKSSYLSVNTYYAVIQKYNIIFILALHICVWICCMFLCANSVNSRMYLLIFTHLPRSNISNIHATVHH
jgi:hypothetical protein